MWFVRVFVARETQGWAINKCDYVPVIAEFFARETQDFASLQADAILMPIPKPSASKSIYAISCVSRGKNAFILTTSFHAFHCHGLLVRRKILRLYWEEMHLLSAISSHVHVGWNGRETQDFASLLGYRH